jgi:hypothetical protein
MLKGLKGYLLCVCPTPFTHALVGFDSTNRTGALPLQNGVRRITSTVLKEIKEPNLTTGTPVQSRPRGPGPRQSPFEPDSMMTSAHGALTLLILQEDKVEVAGRWYAARSTTIDND